MSYQEKYRKAKESGYSDEEIITYLTKKDPEFKNKLETAQNAGYSGEEVLNYFNSSTKEKKLGLGDYASDFSKQTAQGIGIGALGTYGDILDLFGLQSKEILPGEKEKYNRDFNLLDKLQKGETLSLGELMMLSDDEELPRYSRLPSSKDIEESGGKLGLVSKPKTAAGRYGKRIGQLGGSAVSFGAGSVAAPIIAGTAGQTLEEMGAPPWAQAAAEIIATLKLSPKSPNQISSKSKKVDQVLQDLKKTGYSEQDLTLAKSALEERKLLKKYASLTPETENLIIKGVKNSEENLREQIKKGLPGYSEGGLPYLEKEASNVYQSMEELATNISVNNKEPFRKSIQNSIDYLEKSALLPDEKEFIGFLKEGLEKIDKTNTADFLTSFYRKLGKAGNWTDPKTKEHLLTLVKDGIKQTFVESGSEAAKFGKYFEQTNDAWKKWLNARDLMQTIEKAQSTNGTSFKKLALILDDPKNHELAKKVLGPEQVKNIQAITEGAQAIESLLKQIPKSDKSMKNLKILEGLRSLFTGDYRPLAAIVGMEGAKKIATSLLIDPNKQNQMKKIIKAAKNKSLQQVGIFAQEMIKSSSPTKEEE